MLRIFKSAVKTKRVLSTSSAKRFSTVSLSKFQDRVSDITKNSYAQFEDEREDVEFQAFCDKINQFYLLEQEHKDRIARKEHDLKRIILSSTSPIREALQLYTIHNKHGFDEDLLAGCIHGLASVVDITGPIQTANNDVSYEELFNNFRFKDLIADFKYALQQGVNLREETIATIMHSLKKLGYRDPEITSLLLQRIQNIMNGTMKHEFHVDMKEPLKSHQFGKVHYYQATPSLEEVLENKKFRKYMNKLFNHPAANHSDNWSNKNTEQKSDIDELTEVLDNLAGAIAEKKALENEFAKSILSIRDQYQKLSEAQKYAFIAENPVMMKELLEVEENLIDAGVISYEDVIPADNGALTYEENIKAASKTLRNLLIERFPGIFDPAMDKLEQAYAQSQNAERSAEDFPFDKALSKGADYSQIGAALSSLAEGLRKNDIHKAQEELASPVWKNILPELKSFEKMSRVVTVADLKLTAPYTASYQKIHTQLNTFLRSLNENLSVVDSKQLPTFLIHLANTADNLGFHDLFQSFTTRLNHERNSIETLDEQSLFTLLSVLGSAPAGKLPELVQNASKLLDAHLKTTSFLSAEKLIKGLHFLCVHDLSSSSTAFNSLLKKLNSVQLGIVSDELDPELLPFLHDIALYVKLFVPKTQLQISPELTHILEANPTFNTQDFYHEHDFVDPVRDYLQSSLKKLLPSTGGFLPAQFDYIPGHLKGDLYFGALTGDQKTLLFLRGNEPASDSSETPAVFKFHTRLIQKLDPTIQPRIVNYAEIFDIDFKEASFSFQDDSKALNKLLSELCHHSESFKTLQNFTNGLLDYSEQLEQIHLGGEESNASTLEISKSNKLTWFLQGFISELHRFFELDRTAHAALENSSKALYNDKIRYQLAVLASLWSQAPNALKTKFQGSSDIVSVLKNLKEDYPTTDASLNSNVPWMGVRIGLELPTKAGAQTTSQVKDLKPELLNHEFLMDTNYHHYPSWKTSLEGTLNHHNLNYDVEGVHQSGNFHEENRAVSGITPRSNGVRNAIKPLSFAWNWEYYRFEFPKKILIDVMKRELRDLAVQESLEVQTLYKINLQNLKHELKSERTHDEIVGMLTNLEVIQSLITQHLDANTPSKKEAKEVNVQRDPEDYVEFLEHQSRVWIFKDRYANFILDESSRREEIRQLNRELKQHDSTLFKQYRIGKITSDELKQSRKIVNQKLKEKLEAFEKQENDPNHAVEFRGKNFKLDYNIENLVDPNALNNQYSFERDSDAQRTENNVSAWLDLKMRKAETKLIKLAILYKVHSGKNLTQLEQQYLAQWKKAIASSELVDLDMVMVPETRSRGTVADLSKNDKNFFKKFIHFDQEVCKDLALNDLVFEISHFYDSFVIDKTQLASKLEQLSSEWGFSRKLTESISHTKEYRMIHEQIKEYTWRKAGQFAAEDRERIHEMYSVLRGKSQMDRSWLPIDKQSLDEFLDDVNNYDERNKALEQWLERKEVEMNTRGVIKPHPDFLRPDNFFRKIFEKKTQEKHQKAVEELFGCQYKQVTKENLHLFVENLFERLYLLKKYMPKKLLNVIKGVVCHPNISTIDKKNLISALKIHKVDPYEGGSKFVAKNPVQVEGTSLPTDKMFEDIEELQRRIAQASVPFAENLAKRAFSN